MVVERAGNERPWRKSRGAVVDGRIIMSRGFSSVKRVGIPSVNSVASKGVNRKIIDGLHRLERAVLPALEGQSSIAGVVKVTGLSSVEVSRAVQWLEKKGLVRTTHESVEQISLGKIGADVASKGLPERRLLHVLSSQDIPMSLLGKKSGLSRDEANAALGALRSLSAVTLKKDKDLVLSITDKGRAILSNGFSEELLLHKNFPLSVKSLSVDERRVYSQLRKRKDYFRSDVLKIQHIFLEPLGRDVLSTGIKDDSILDRVTTTLLKSKGWFGKTFRRYDVSANVPQTNFGKVQMYRAFLDDVRQKFVSLGFQEMSGPIVESEFWNMDALFMPQFHSARDIHDVYYVESPSRMSLDQSIIKRVKQAHESGVDGSTGWNYSFNVDKTCGTILRSQGTSCSSRILASPNLKIPGKYFGITRVFRKDVIDATHLADFNQTEGIVIEEGLNMRHLVGLLKMFAKEFAGTDEVRIVPGYFPFTEPSAELFAKHPTLGWVELGGAGIFRPEVVSPLLGRNVSVLAWGLGIDRLGMFKLGISDIRSLFSQDLDYLRNSKVV